MAVNRACYATRRDVLTATSIQETYDYVRHVDSAIEAASGSVERLCKRRFWNNYTTQKWDWPNFQRAYPWRIWFDEREIADVTGTVPVVTSGGNVIPASSILWGPWNYSPPFTFMELDRSTSASFGQGQTPQQDVHIQAVFGYWAETRPGGTLAAAVSDTTGTTFTVSDASIVGVGDVLTIGSESVLVRDLSWVTTGQTQSGSGVSTADTADNILAVSDGTKIHADEILQLDAEWMLALSVTGNNVTVQRAYGGTVLATHSGATVYAQRNLTVARGFGGTTAATHSNADTVLAALIPDEVHELAIAEAEVLVFQKLSGYARTIGENGGRPVPGGSLPDLRARVQEHYGRKHRQAVI